MKELPLKRSRILLVDDEPDNLSLLEAILEADGYSRVDSATSAAEALAMRVTGPYDLLVIDMHMPGVDGLALLEQLGREDEHAVVPTMVVTADHSREARLAALDRGARDFVTKPIDCSEFLVRVRHLLEVRWLYNGLDTLNHRLSDRIEQQRRGLEDADMELLRHLGRAAEFRDNETGLHAVRMSEYAYHLARRAGLSEAEAQRLRHACPMHDIGKIGVPDEILLKPGKLTPEEFDEIKRHTLIGGEILAGHASPVVVMAREIALSHHERWNGTGYPYGLAGRDIPLVGRIAAIADVFDALTSERPYKRAWTVEAAIAEIERGAGTQFDPVLVACFMAIEPQLREVKATYAEPAAQSLSLLGGALRPGSRVSFGSAEAKVTP